MKKTAGERVILWICIALVASLDQRSPHKLVVTIEPSTCFSIAASFCALPLAVIAQPYPNKPVRIVVGFGPGSGTDIIARIVAEELRQAFGQTFVVDNKPGATAAIAAESEAARRVHSPRASPCHEDGAR